VPTATFPDGHSFRLEVARTSEERSRGYMFREKVGPEEGMLFPLPKTTSTPSDEELPGPVDLIWLSGTLAVVHIEARVPPCAHDPAPATFRCGRPGSSSR